MRTYAARPGALPGLNAPPWRHHDFISVESGEPLRPARLPFRNGFHSCKLQDDPICLFPLRLLSRNYGSLQPRLRGGPHKICSRGLSEGIPELHSAGTAAEWSRGRWGGAGGEHMHGGAAVDFCSSRHIEPPFSKILVPEVRGEGRCVPLLFPQGTWGYPSSKEASQMVNGTEVCT